MTIEDKFRIIIDEFQKRADNSIDIYDKVLRFKLGKEKMISHKTLASLMRKLNEECNYCLEKLKKKRRTTYRLIDYSKILKELLESGSYLDSYKNMGMILEMIRENDPKLYRELSRIESIDRDVYIFRGYPLEDIKDITIEEKFNELVNHIKNRDYIKIVVHGKTYEEVKPLKLVFVNNNWYLANIGGDKRLRLTRLSFIESISYDKKSEKFQLGILENELDFLQNKLQNAMTLYGVDRKVAKLKALPNIAKYFKDGMKRFFLSQKLIEELEDGSIILEIEYTQKLEILPFVQKWAPDLLILKPKSLKDAYLKKLQSAVENQSQII